jgi:hypothetical protein
LEDSEKNPVLNISTLEITGSISNGEVCRIVDEVSLRSMIVQMLVITSMYHREHPEKRQENQMESLWTIGGCRKLYLNGRIARSKKIKNSQQEFSTEFSCLKTFYLSSNIAHKWKLCTAPEQGILLLIPLYSVAW